MSYHRPLNSLMSDFFVTTPICQLMALMHGHSGIAIVFQRWHQQLLSLFCSAIRAYHQLIRKR